MSAQSKWQGEYQVEMAARPETLWRLFADVNGWKAWNAGIEEIHLEGPFAQGTEFTMKPPGQDAFRSRLVEVRENEVFVDETRVEELLVTVTHRIEKLGADRVRVTYAADARGPGAEDVGPAIASDFPDVLKALAALAESAEEVF